MNKDENIKDFYVIDIQHILKCVWRRLWAISLAGVNCGRIGFTPARFIVPQKYRAKIMM